MENEETGRESALPSPRTDLPPRFWFVPGEVPDRQPDNIFGVAQETSVNRNFWVDEVVETIKKGGKIAVIIADVDGLKRLNEDFSRGTGDTGIKHMGCIVGQEIDKLFPSNEVPAIRFFRVSGQADEICFVIHSPKGFSLKEQLKDLTEKLGNYPVAMEEVLVAENGQSKKKIAEFSFSTGVASTEDPNYASFVKESLAFLKSGEIQRAYELFERLREDAKKELDRLKGGKISKEIERLKQLDEETPIGHIIEKAVNRFSSIRTGREAFTEMLKEVVRRATKGERKRLMNSLRKVLADQGIDEESFMSALSEELKK